MVFVSQKVITTGGVFDMCELRYSSLICFQEHCFLCPLFHTYGFFSQKVVTTGVVFDMCELCYSSWIHFQEHCFPCPLFQITQPSIEPT